MEQVPVISFRRVTKQYEDGVPVLNDVSFDIERGKFYTLLGPSGCGKTTILRLIAGFMEPTSGEIRMDGKLINDLPANKRQVNTVFQDYALFPHLNVFDNVAFGLRIRKLKKDEIERKVEEALRFVNLEGYGKREIREMSGGQRQRVAIARAIVNEPKLLLLDEPLSALDLKLRTEMQYELRELQRRLGITFIFVTHDQEEALAMSDEIFVLNKGIIEQSGTPTDIYDEPINRFVADFIGESNIVPGRMLDDYRVEFAGKEFECVDRGLRRGEPVEIVIRPEDLEMTAAGAGKLAATVDTQLFRGVHYEIICMDDSGNEWMVHSTRKAVVGEAIGLDFDPEAIHVMRFGESEEDFDRRLEGYEDAEPDAPQQALGANAGGAVGAQPGPAAGQAQARIAGAVPAANSPAAAGPDAEGPVGEGEASRAEDAALRRGEAAEERREPGEGPPIVETGRPGGNS